MEKLTEVREVKRLQFNVSGTLFETLETTLHRFPSTLLGSPEKRSKVYCRDTKQHFLDRNRVAFEAILFFYQSYGRLVRPPELSMEIFEAECEYFLIPSDMINEMKVREGYLSLPKDVVWNPQTFLDKVWEVFEYPESSKIAYFVGATSILMLSTSIFVMCAQTLPGVKFHQSSLAQDYHYIDLAVSFWFTLEYVTRLVSCPNWKQFLSSFMNSIDLLASVPYFVLLIFKRHSYLSFVRVLRMFRLIRLLQLTGSSSRLTMLRSVILSSLGDLGLLFLCLMIVIFIGGSIMYIIEVDVENTPFTSIPQSSWWAIQTVVVLGYGDIVPTTEVGKLIASFFMIFGALTISLPVLSVVSKLVKIYDKTE